MSGFGAGPEGWDPADAAIAGGTVRVKVVGVPHFGHMHIGTISTTAPAVVVAREGLVGKLFRSGEGQEWTPVGGGYVVVHAIPVEANLDGPILGYRGGWAKVDVDDGPVPGLP